jgi:hypothetical protein
VTEEAFVAMYVFRDRLADVIAAPCFWINRLLLRRLLLRRLLLRFVLILSARANGANVERQREERERAYNQRFCSDYWPRDFAS